MQSQVTSGTIVVHDTTPARPAPRQSHGVVAWLKGRLFGSWAASIGTVAVLCLLLLVVPSLWRWAVLDAVWGADFDACQVATGACWGVVTEKFRIILFGRYPFEAQWRPFLATCLMLALLVASGKRRFWTTALWALWPVVLVLAYVLMAGGMLGLPAVETDRWGGLPLTILLASLSMAIAFPLGLLLALGRTSDLPVIRALCRVYTEIIRGVPLISVLFMASFMFPLLLPQGFSIDVLLRVLIGISLFAAAYTAEVLRGGLQAMPKGQWEAAYTLGLSYWQIQRKVVLPQALAMVVPGIVNNFISTFKDTSLVTIVGLYELTGALSLALNSDANWRPFKVEAYLFVAAIYFVFCFAMSLYSRSIERQLQRSATR